MRGKRVIITAAASGIGQVITRAFVEEGARVEICDLDASLLAECEADLPGVGTTQADVSDPEQVERFMEQAAARLGGLDVLVNNAGIAGPTAPVEEVTPADWRRTMAVNIDGQFYCARKAVPLLKRSGGGSIVNISSSAGLFGYPLRSPYAASKWAVIGFTKTLAMELGPFGIRVNAICPGPVEGARMDAVIDAQAEAQDTERETIRQGYLRQTSMRTFVDKRDVANLVLFLCSPAGNKISGQALSVDGHTETLRTL